MDAGLLVWLAVVADREEGSLEEAPAAALLGWWYMRRRRIGGGGGDDHDVIILFFLHKKGDLWREKRDELPRPWRPPP